MPACREPLKNRAEDEGKNFTETTLAVVFASRRLNESIAETQRRLQLNGVEAIAASAEIRAEAARPKPRGADRTAPGLR